MTCKLQTGETTLTSYENRVYAGIIGKMIGVYAGRPVEGWSYRHIHEKFDYIQEYVNQILKIPLHVPDDDLSGTFVFLRALEDFGIEVDSEKFGETWLNYLIENKTIFWWGGMCRSTEHTAYIRLKNGIKAPVSGSSDLNGKAVSEQIGALIFIDGYALLCPDDPVKAIHFARRAASVSHDGFAVEAACFWVTLESLAFRIKPVNELIDEALKYEWSAKLRRMVAEIRQVCEKKEDWRIVRSWLEEHYGYHLYPGNCHVVPNFMLMLSSLLLGGDDFSKALSIVISSGWDTDCNAGNLCCLNGIRLGLHAIDPKWRAPLNDRFYCVSSLGSRCVTDAVIETQRILILNAMIYQKEKPLFKPKFNFSFPGSTQGFVCCPVVSGADSQVINQNDLNGESGLIIQSGCNTAASISTLTFYDPRDRYGGYELIGSPTLYEGQTVEYVLKPLGEYADLKVYVVTNDGIIRIISSPVQRIHGEERIAWRIPDLKGVPIERLGIQLLSDDSEVSLLVKSIHWDGAPKHLKIHGVLREEDGKAKRVFDAFTSSASHFQVDKAHTLCLSHLGKNGVADFGSEEWKDYTFSADIIPAFNERCGLVIRTHGHRKYYAVVLEEQRFMRIILRNGPEETVLKETGFVYEWDKQVALSFSCVGTQLTAQCNGEELKANDASLSCGGAGFIASNGTMLIDNIQVKAEA